MAGSLPFLITLTSSVSTKTSSIHRAGPGTLPVRSGPHVPRFRTSTPCRSTGMTGLSQVLPTVYLSTDRCIPPKPSVPRCPDPNSNHIILGPRQRPRTRLHKTPSSPTKTYLPVISPSTSPRTSVPDDVVELHSITRGPNPGLCLFIKFSTVRPYVYHLLVSI